MGSCACWSSRTRRRWRGCSRVALTERGDVVDDRGHRRGRRSTLASTSRLRRGPARRDASRTMEGFEVCRRLRRAQVWTPVLMLTARNAVADRITGLDGGADDYLRQAVRLRRAAGPAARAGTARARFRGRPCSPSATSRSTRRRGGSGGRGQEIELSRDASSPCSRPSCAVPDQVLSRDQLLEPRVGLGVRDRVQRRRRLRPLPPREDRPPVRAEHRSRTVRGLGYRLTAEDRCREAGRGFGCASGSRVASPSC